MFHHHLSIQSETVDCEAVKKAIKASASVEVGRAWAGMVLGQDPGPWRTGTRCRWAERLFDSGDLRLLLLQLVAENKLRVRTDQDTGEPDVRWVCADSGVAYPTLTMLEEEGLAVATTEGGKKVFTATEAGQAMLAENKARLDEIQARLQQAGQVFERGRSPQIMQAFLRLRGAVKGRAGRGRLTQEQITKLAGVIEAAAKSIDEL